LRLSFSELRREGAVRRYQLRRLQRSWSRHGDCVAKLTIVVDVDCHEPMPCMRITGWAFGQQVDQRLEIIAQPQLLICVEK
jgi:hypothetical protein